MTKQQKWAALWARIEALAAPTSSNYHAAYAVLAHTEKGTPAFRLATRYLAA